MMNSLRFTKLHFQNQMKSGHLRPDRKPLGWVLPLLLIGLFTSTTLAKAPADEHLYAVEISKTGINYTQPKSNWWRDVPHVVVDSPQTAQQKIEAWVSPARPVGWNSSSGSMLLVRTTEPLASLTGKLYLRTENPDQRLRGYEFHINDLKPYKTTPNEFYGVLENYYAHMIALRLPGQSWFRYQRNEARKRQGELTIRSPQNGRNNWGMDSAMDLFTGSRGITENIQLDRQLWIRNHKEARTVDIESIKGITIEEIDWKPLLDGRVAKVDSLANTIPHDQHAVFIPSLQQLLAILSQSDQLLTPAFTSFEAKSVDRHVIQRYLDQMNLDLNRIAGKPFAVKIKSIAVTGSDPYSELGADVGVIVEFSDDDAAIQFVSDVLDDKWIGDLEVNQFSQIEGGVSLASIDRSKSLAIFHKANRVWVSNSTIQLRKLWRCHQDEIPCISELPGYQFFRLRHKNSPTESSFAFMSDAAIRRWCGPQWRIGQSRRVQALSFLRAEQARRMRQWSSLQPGKTVLLEDMPQSVTDILGTCYLTHSGVVSSRFGSTRFATPIAEMELAKVSKSEQAAYDRWRTGYERNWSGAFDPIAIQVSMKPKSMEMDLSVMPLTLFSSYRFFQGSEGFEANGGDQHPGSIIHLIASPGSSSGFSTFYKGLKHFEVYVDEHPTYWKDLFTEKESQEYFEENIDKFPFALGADFDTPERMKAFASFSTGLFGGLDNDKVELIHNGVTYIRHEVDIFYNRKDPSFVYMLQHENRLVLAFNKEMIKKAIDRIQGKKSKGDQGTSVRPWLGESIGFQSNQKTFRALETLWGRYYLSELRDQTWKNLPILREWKREFPERDPLEVHRKYWQESLLCAAGGELKWDAKTKLVTSTMLGSPGKPKIPMNTPPPFANFESFDAGITLKDNGLRARVILRTR